MGVSRLTGMNSEAMRTTTQSVLASTAPQAGRTEPYAGSEVAELVTLVPMTVMGRESTSGWRQEIRRPNAAEPAVRGDDAGHRPRQLL